LTGVGRSRIGLGGSGEVTMGAGVTKALCVVVGGLAMLTDGPLTGGPGMARGSGSAMMVVVGAARLTALVRG
jgi:hypothetical protein